MRKFIVLLLISVLAFGCENEEPEPEPIIAEEAERAERVKSLLISELEEYHMGIFFIQSDKYLGNLVVFQESENLSLELVADELGLSAEVLFNVDGHHNKVNLYYRYEEIKGVEVEHNSATYNTNIMILNIVTNRPG